MFRWSFSRWGFYCGESRDAESGNANTARSLRNNHFATWTWSGVSHRVTFLVECSKDWFARLLCGWFSASSRRQVPEPTHNVKRHFLECGWIKFRHLIGSLYTKYNLFDFSTTLLKDDQMQFKVKDDDSFFSFHKIIFICLNF